ncbi:PQQ-dependent sugar dehydrogenase [Natranaerofaba carboxydovora]|uniref:PQQ-dependent sugar dehydrogenase n=1 Tax=Natranaerofaba carboxydovora TaxID=2742683 RepID=UPI001F12A9E7|nr:PQQ-dependent sugar dehydrogenase [Natranaerofaba carboxydovora]UMZ74650.1 Quinoprotein glucose dehydrogenase B [Natranaerofaba carboxydovora]
MALKSYGYYALVGAASGIVGGIMVSLFLWGGWMLPALGLLLTSVSLIEGLVVVLVMTTLVGVIYGVAIREKVDSFAASVLIGVGIGFLVWGLGTLILIPLALGFPPVFANPLDHGLSLLAFLVYGISMTLLYRVWLGKKKEKWQYIVPAVVLLIGIISAPLLLRAAVTTSPGNLAVHDGYEVDVVAKNFTYPTSLTFCEEGYVYVAEAGYAYGPKETTPRLLRVDPKGGNIKEISTDFNGPINGLTYKDGMIYVSHRGKISKIDKGGGEVEDLITGLPSHGDHQNNDLLFDPDGKLYFGQGSATNAGIVGDDNYIYGWLQDYPEFHDIPPEDISLRGVNYKSQDLGEILSAEEVETGAFMPFGSRSEKGQEIKGETPGNAAIYRADPDEDYELELYAWGLRNPYGLTFSDKGELFTTVLGYDDRGPRAVEDASDFIYRVEEGGFYGWPDYVGTEPIESDIFQSDRGEELEPLLEDHPEVEEPYASFPPHFSPMKLDIAPGEFAEVGSQEKKEVPKDIGPSDIFVAVFGDGEPMTGETEDPVPAMILRLDPGTEHFYVFLENKGEKPRAGRFGQGLNRPIAVKFDPEGESLYVLDFGVFEFSDMAPNAIPRTGVLWKVTPEN